MQVAFIEEESLRLRVAKSNT